MTLVEYMKDGPEWSRYGIDWKHYGEVIPGYLLVEALASCRPGSPQGSWALLDANDSYRLCPAFSWAVAPAADPHERMTDADIDAADAAGLFEAEEETFDAAFECLEEALKGHPVAGHDLVTACIQAGYDLEGGPFLAVWLCDRMARHVAAFEARASKTKAP